MNVVFFVVLMLLVGGAMKGYKRGMVEELSKVIALILALVAIGMFVVAATGYMDHLTLRTILGIVCMTIAILIYRITDFILSSLKLISSIPVLRGVNHLLGLAVGALEAVLLVWAVFIVAVAFEFGGISSYILESIRENRLLTWLFQNNYLADLISGWLPVIAEVFAG